jgi:hypothetical protein
MALNPCPVGSAFPAIVQGTYNTLSRIDGPQADRFLIHVSNGNINLPKPLPNSELAWAKQYWMRQLRAVRMGNSPYASLLIAADNVNQYYAALNQLLEPIIESYDLPLLGVSLPGE